MLFSKKKTAKSESSKDTDRDAKFLFRNIWPPSADNLMQELSFITPKLLPAPAHLRAPQRPNKRRNPNQSQQKIQSRTAPFKSQPKLPFSRDANIQV